MSPHRAHLSHPHLGSHYTGMICMPVAPAQIGEGTLSPAYVWAHPLQVSGTQQTKPSGSVAERTAFVFHRERRLCLLPAQPHCSPDAVSFSSAAPRSSPGMGMHYLMPDLAFVSVASTALRMPPLVSSV